MGKRERDKGKVGERELAAKLRELGHSQSRRGVQYQGGADSPDVVGIPGVHIECKRTETLSVYAAMAQAVAESRELVEVPVVAHRRNHKDWLLVIRLDDVTEFCRRWLANQHKEASDGSEEAGA